MEFGFSVVADVLGDGHMIRDNARLAFSARLKHFQRLGFPEGINTGRGRAATYHIGHLIHLAIALELAQLGVTPERAVDYVSDNRAEVAAIAAKAAHSVFSDSGEGYVLAFQPSHLLPLMFNAPDHTEKILLFKSFSDVAEITSPGRLARNMPRFAYANLTYMFSWLISYLSAALKVESEDVLQAIDRWCSTEPQLQGKA